MPESKVVVVQAVQSLEQAMDASTQDPPAEPASVVKRLSISQDRLRMFCQRWWRPISTCAAAILKEQSDDHIPLPPMPGKLQSCCLHHHPGTVMTCAVIEQAGRWLCVMREAPFAQHIDVASTIHIP